MEVLKIENIVASYGRELIVDDISFHMKKSEFTGLLGLNGTGKTTLLKVICGLLKPKSGKCFIDNKDMMKYKEKERAKYISFMPQRHSIIYDTTVLEVVLMGITPYLGTFGHPTNEHRKIAYDILEKMDMEECANKNFLQLSEGQKQLIIVARSLMQNSQFMLFDEPNSALDFNNSHMILSKIREVIKKERKSGLITLHDPNMALTYCDRIIVLKDKKKFADFYIKDTDSGFIQEVFNKIYEDIEIIHYNGKYMIVK
ncbi:ABC transporter ATP-binding protein [Tissierella pigra]|uniref:ABC transporter ATP-binding protein n=1 Tax=Tissierella pigra TaxID=2607614 RepID=A0A6N7XW14_9FIRM|nr:ABC transporter ATP-binding protein [Tissierella pigra]MSU00488.1 ABC transporter ATP-binding protein [Tissierella pigra]